MNEMERYPGTWEEMPEELKRVASGEAVIYLVISSCLEYLEHLVYPVYKDLDGLKVLDPACGTGEALMTMAVKYKNTLFTAVERSTEALALAQQFANDLQLENINFLSCLPEEGDFNFIMPTRPLQHIDDLAGFLAGLQERLAWDGLMVVHAYTGSHPEENLYLQEAVSELRRGDLNQQEGRDLIGDLIAQPLKEHIDGLRECNRMLENAGLKLLNGLHPRQYEPERYLQLSAGDLFDGLNRVDRAYLAEQFSGQFLRHSLLYSKKDYTVAMPSADDVQASKYIPHLSPYVGDGLADDRKIVGLKHEYLLLPEDMEYMDLNLPPDLFRVLQGIDGKKNCEQVHRRFLPLPWERFWALIQACCEEEIIYLHRA